MSKSKSDDDFWDRYKAFGAQAEAYCAADRRWLTTELIVA